MVEINLIANILIMVSVTFFIIGVFGRKNIMIERMPIFEQYFLRVALSTLGAGALLNVLTYDHPSLSELVFNVGTGLIFAWAAWFHWTYFVKKK